PRGPNRPTHERARNANRRNRACLKRLPREKETQRWIDVIKATARRCEEQAPKTRCWFQLDREGDAGTILSELQAMGHQWTVRSSSDRRVILPHGGTSHLRHQLDRRLWL